MKKLFTKTIAFMLLFALLANLSAGCSNSDAESNDLSSVFHENSNSSKDTTANNSKDTTANNSKDTTTNDSKDTTTTDSKDTTTNESKDTTTKDSKDTPANDSKDTPANESKDTSANESKDTSSSTDKVPPAKVPVNSAKLTFSKESGVYKSEFQLTINHNSSGKLYYTTDGSNPATSDTKIEYTGSISIKDRKTDKNYVTAVNPKLFDAANVTVTSNRKNFINTIKAPSNKAVDKCTVIRAAVKDTAGNYSKCETATYFVGAMTEHIQGIEESCKASGTSLAVISISIDYDDLFDSKKGIYVKGDIFEKALEKHLKTEGRVDQDVSRALDANYKQKGREWERQISMQFFESDGKKTNLALSQDCGIRIQGNYSRSDLQKGLRLYARSDYGKKNFNYAVFGEDFKDDSGKTMDKFKTLVLRAGGNCAFLAKYNDTYWQDLASEMNFETQKSRPCVVYIDGEYWGLYVLQEDYSDDYFEETHGLNKEDVIVYKGDAEAIEIGYKLDEGDLPAGITDESYYFKDLLNFFKKHKNLKSQADYNEFARLVDVESVKDYFAVNAWINNKWDWPGKNWSLWKTKTVNSKNPYNDGRWRFCLYDIEFGGVSGGGEASANTIKEANYKPLGLLDKDTENPAVLCFAYLMTNDNFRAEYCDRLLSINNTYFEKEHAISVLKKYRDTYAPLYEQFFNRYPKSGSKDDAVNGGYASYKCISDFINRRGKNIQKMITYINKTLG